MTECDPIPSYKVVVNHEEQYSIWPADSPAPGGWREAGKAGPKEECLDYIRSVWTDMRPLSLRRRMLSEPATDAAAAAPSTSPRSKVESDAR